MSDTITISEAAKAHIETVRQERAAGPGLGFYLGVKKSGCNGWLYAPDIIDELSNTMKAIVHDNFTLYVPCASWSILKGTHIDIISKDLGQKVLVYQNPNAASECGCGESFSIQTPGGESV